MKTYIINGRAICPASGLDSQVNILIEGGKIAAVKTAAEFSAAETAGAEIIDAAGCWVTPGLIDMHVHFREPGQTHKETIETGSKAAAAGGFTTVCCMPNTSPVTDTAQAVREMQSKATDVRLLVVGSITKGLAGEKLSDIAEMQAAGICAISDDGKTVENPALYAEAMRLAASLNLPVLAHCEEPRLVGGGLVNLSEAALKLGIPTIPEEAEEIIIARDITLARMTGAKLHICHVSTKRGAQLIREAQQAGQAVTAEVAPHHFTLTDSDIYKEEKLTANYRMAPALRNTASRDAMRQALKDGTIQAIATDHAPHTQAEKSDFHTAPNGIIGLETAVPLAITELVQTGILTPPQLIAKFTSNPAKILNLPYGTLSQGAAADITIINPDLRHKINADTFQSMARNTPFNGRAVQGKAIRTIIGGKTIYAEKKA